MDKINSIYEQLIGQKFNNLTIIELIYLPLEKSGGYRYQFKCKCDCGNEIITLCKYIKNEDVKNCGDFRCPYKQQLYLKKRLSTINKYKEYVGQKINHLTIIDFIYNENTEAHKRYQFRCECDCGNVTIKKCNSLVNDKIQTCGEPDCELGKGKLIIDAIVKYKEYIGQKFNHLTIIDVVYDKTAKTTYRYQFRCKCDCGNECVNPIYHVLNDKNKNCNFLDCCYNPTNQSIEKYKSMIGQKFNKLTITNFIYNEKEVEQYYRFQFKCKCDCGNDDYYTAVDQLLYRTPNGCSDCYTPSKIELSFRNWLEEINLNFTKSRIDSISSLQNKVEIDFLINNIGIELHGLSVHATTDGFFDSPYIGKKYKTYHLNKLESCKKQEINLIQFWNTEWIQKPDIVKSIVLNQLNKPKYREYARKCAVKEIDKQTYDEFMNKHHIQGTTNGESIRLGLFYKENNKLVSVMSFGSSRYSNFQWEMYRFVNYSYTQIVGGASKLFKNFVRNYNPTSIVSYSDRRLFDNGKLYDILGFNFLHNSDPGYWYFKNKFSDYQHDLQHRSLFMKHKLKDKLKTFDPNLTEWENMEKNGYLRIYDCGNKVYYWKK